MSVVQGLRAAASLQPVCKLIHWVQFFALMQKPQPSIGQANGTDRSRIAVLGASGYTGEEVIRLMALHPTFAATVLTGESQAGKVNDLVK